MIKTLIFIIVLFPSICFAEASGYLFLGKYMNHEQQDLESRDISYYAGIYLEIKTKAPTLFMQNKTLIRTIDSQGASPVQINYSIGLKQRIKDVEIIFKHECLHPVDGISGGSKKKSYDLIEGRINF